MAKLWNLHKIGHFQQASIERRKPVLISKYHLEVKYLLCPATLIMKITSSTIKTLSHLHVISPHHIKITIESSRQEITF